MFSARPARAERAGGGLGRIGLDRVGRSRAVSSADATQGVPATMASRDARDLESGFVESGVGPSEASDWSDVRWRDTPGSYGSVSDRGSSEGSPRFEAGSGELDRDAKPPRESTLAWLWRVGEPVVFWTACTAVAAFSMYSMVRMTSSPGYPSSPPQGHDGRSVQVGTIANSSQAIAAYRGCEATSGGATLRNDVGTRRFPDFLLAGAAGAPADALAAFLEAKQVACAGKLEESLREDVRRKAHERRKAEEESGVTYVETEKFSPAAKNSIPSSRAEEDSFPTGVVTRGGETGEGEGELFANRDVLVSSPSSLGWRPSTRWPSDDDGERFFADARWRRQPAPLEAQKAYLDAHFHRCGEDGSPFLSVPRFQNTRDLLYTGWAPLRMCETMGGDDARVVAILANPIDHAASVFAETLLPHRDDVARWATLLNDADAVAEVGRRDDESKNATKTKTMPHVSYSRAGFEVALDVDLHIAETCGSDGLLLGTMDASFKTKRACCAAAAAEKGFAAWPGCPGGCSNPGLSDDERASCDARGELGFSPVRAGAWVDHLRRMYERVPAQNVMVVTADQAKQSGLPTLAVAVVGWRLLGLPLVDPVSVSIDLQRARARAAAAAAAAARVGEEDRRDESETAKDVSTLGGDGEEKKRRDAYQDALLAIFGENDAFGADADFFSATSALGATYDENVGVFDANENENVDGTRLDRYVAALPSAFLETCDDGVATSSSTREKLARYHGEKVVALNALLGNGDIRWWDEETLVSVAATQEAVFLETKPGPYGTGRDPSAATGMTAFSSLVRRAPDASRV